MKVILLYLHIARRAEEFSAYGRRFIETYMKFPPGIEHELHVVNCNGLGLQREAVEIYHPAARAYHQYDGEGFDIGAHQAVGKTLDCDFLVCTSSQTYFWKSGWLKRFVEARENHGDGFYGIMASHECAPHLRTCFYGLNPRNFAAYPHTINSKEDSWRFEHQDWCISEWFMDRGNPALLVTWDGCYEKKDWMTVPNGFRKGDQSNCLAFDRHSLIYQESSGEEKTTLEWLVYGKPDQKQNVD